MAILRERHLHMCSGRRNRCAVAALCVAAGWLGAHTVAFAGQQVQQQARHLHRSKVALEAKKSAYNFFVGHVLSHAAFKDAAAADGVRPMKMAGVIWRTLLPEEKEQFKQIELAEELVNDLLKRYHEQMASHSAPSPAPIKTVSRAPAREASSSSSVALAPKKLSGTLAPTMSGYDLFQKAMLMDEEFQAAHSQGERLSAVAEAWGQTPEEVKEEYERTAASLSEPVAPKPKQEREVKEEHKTTAASLSEPVAPKPKQKRPLPPDSGSGSKPKKLNGYNLFIRTMATDADFRDRFGDATGAKFIKKAAEVWKDLPESAKEEYKAKAARLNAAAQEQADSQ